MAFSNVAEWNDETKVAAACGASCGAGDKPEEKPSACGADDKPEEKPSSCGASDK